MQKILLIDDDQSITFLVHKILSDAGFEVVVSNNSSQGLNLAKEIQPDLIIMDLVMPKVDGAEAVTILKASPITSTIPVLFFTGLMSSKDKNDTQSLFVSGKDYQVIAKPFEFNALINKVKEVIG